MCCSSSASSDCAVTPEGRAMARGLQARPARSDGGAGLAVAGGACRARQAPRQSDGSRVARRGSAAHTLCWSRALETGADRVNAPAEEGCVCAGWISNMEAAEKGCGSYAFAHGSVPSCGWRAAAPAGVRWCTLRMRFGIVPAAACFPLCQSCSCAGFLHPCNELFSDLHSCARCTKRAVRQIRRALQRSVGAVQGSSKGRAS